MMLVLLVFKKWCLAVYIHEEKKKKKKKKERNLISMVLQWYALNFYSKLIFFFQLKKETEVRGI